MIPDTYFSGETTTWSVTAPSQPRAPPPEGESGSERVRSLRTQLEPADPEANLANWESQGHAAGTEGCGVED